AVRQHHRSERLAGSSLAHSVGAHRSRSRFVPWYDILWYDRIVKVDKLSVSFDPELGDAVRSAARRSGRGLSSWLADAAAAKLRAEALADFLDDWEAKRGPLTADELASAAAE